MGSDGGFAICYRVAVHVCPYIQVFFEYNPDIMMTFQLGDLPTWLLWFAAIASALIAGVSEEVGFRGYMQVPLEAKYKPWVVYIIVPVAFVLFHLNQGWVQPSMFGILFGGSFL